MRKAGVALHGTKAVQFELRGAHFGPYDGVNGLARVRIHGFVCHLTGRDECGEYPCSKQQQWQVTHGFRNREKISCQLSLPFKVQRYGERPAHHLFQNSALLEAVVVYQDVVKSLGNFEFRGKNEVGEKELNARPVLKGEVGGRNFDQTRCLSGAGIAGHVERIFDAPDHKKAKIVVRRRFVAHVKRHFHQNRFDGARHAAGNFARLGIAEVAFQKRQSRQETHVEIVTQFQVGDDTEVKTWPCNGLGPEERVILDKLFGAENPEIALVIAQSDAKVVVFILEVQIIDVAPLVELRICQRKGQTPSQQTENDGLADAGLSGHRSYFVAV